MNKIKDMETMNDRFKKIRLNVGLNQVDFASSLGIKQGSLSGIEKGKVNVSSKIARGLIEKYNVNIDWVYSGIGTMYCNKILDVDSERSIMIETIDTCINDISDRMDISDKEYRLRVSTLNKIKELIKKA